MVVTKKKPALKFSDLDRAIYIDYEGNKPRPGSLDIPAPILLGYLIDNELKAGILDPLFSQHCSNRYRAKDAEPASHATLAGVLIHRALNEERVIVSWSEHDLKHMIRIRPELEKEIREVHRNAITPVRLLLRRRGELVKRGEAKLYTMADRFGVANYEKYGEGLTGAAIRRIRAKLTKGADWTSLADPLKDDWRAIVKHNAQDLRVMRELLRKVLLNDI